MNRRRRPGRLWSSGLKVDRSRLARLAKYKVGENSRKPAEVYDPAVKPSEAANPPEVTEAPESPTEPTEHNSSEPVDEAEIGVESTKPVDPEPVGSSEPGAKSTEPVDPEPIKMSTHAAESAEAINSPEETVHPQLVTKWVLTRPANLATFDPFKNKPATVSQSIKNTSGGIQC